MNEVELRQEAVKRIKARQEFYGHLAAYLIVNAAFIALWWFSGAGYFWPMWVLIGWGIGLAFHAWGTFKPPKPITEDAIRKEMERLQPRHG